MTRKAGDLVRSTHYDLLKNITNRRITEKVNDLTRGWANWLLIRQLRFLNRDESDTEVLYSSRNRFDKSLTLVGKEVANLFQLFHGRHCPTLLFPSTFCIYALWPGRDIILFQRATTKRPIVERYGPQAHKVCGC